MTGRSPDGSGYSAEPEPSCTVSAVPVSIPNAPHDLWCLCGDCTGRKRKPVATQAEEIEALRAIIAELGYCAPNASLEFMRLIPAEVRATRAKLALLRPRNYSDSTMVPAELWELLEQVWVIADNYDLREAIEAHPVHKDFMADTFMWRDCMEVLNAIATEARRATTTKIGVVHEGAGPKDIAQ